MKINFFDADYEKRYYNSVVWERGNILLLDEYYTTKREAINAINKFKKDYNKNYPLDCFVRVFEDDGFSVHDINL